MIGCRSRDEIEGRVRQWRIRLLYLVCAGGVVVLGLGSRRFGVNLPAFVAAYAGDTLWALMVFLGLGAVAPRSRTSRRAALALAVSYAVEASQLYHAPWIDALRHTRLGGLILGFGFMWSDLLCYTVGIAWGVALERVAWQSVGLGSRTRGGSIKPPAGS
jgi:hypothetical protein